MPQPNEPPPDELSGLGPAARGPSLGSPNLVLVPTRAELVRLADDGGFPPGLGQVRVCGFGPVAAAARTAELVALLRPRRVVLCGIAGSYDLERCPIAHAFAFGAVAIEGVGVGEGADLIRPPALGFPQWPGSGAECRPPDAVLENPIYDRIELDGPPGAEPLLLTTCAASATPAQAQRRLAHFPTAVAEDMEGFAVATACRLAGVPLWIVRGISNAVGDRDPAHWHIPAALAAARRLAIELLEGGEPA